MKITASKKNKRQKNNNAKGIALVFALVVLAVLTALSYSIVSRISARKHRQQYLIDYQKARYACDSGVKYALNKIGTLKLDVIERADKPDFSDLFWMNEDDLYELKTEWAYEIDQLREEEQDEKQQQKKEVTDSLSGMLSLFGLGDPNQLAQQTQQGDQSGDFIYTDPNSLDIPGPYGFEWPLVAKPMEFEIGDAKIYITIEDENAKLPVTLSMMDDGKTVREREACFNSFFEWMGVDPEDADKFFDEIEKVADVKKYDTDLKDITTITKQEVKTKSRSRRTARRNRRRSTKRTRYRTKKTTRPKYKHMTDFALLMNDYMDNGFLQRASLISEGKEDEPIRYLGVFGSQKVNINTAPRHVLEAVFSFGGDSVPLADSIIIERHEKPFENLDDLKDRLLGYSDSIDKVKDMIVMQSKYLTINVKAVSGNATAKTILAVTKDGKNVQKIATIRD